MTPSNRVKGSWRVLWAPPAGSTVEPQPKSNLVHFSLEIWVTSGSNNFYYFPENQPTKFKLYPKTSLFLSPQGFLWRILRRRRCLWTALHHTYSSRIKSHHSSQHICTEHSTELLKQRIIGRQFVTNATATNQLNFGRLLLRYSYFVPHDLNTLLCIHC